MALDIFSLSSRKKHQERIKSLGKVTNTRFTIIRLDGTVLADSQEDPKSMDNHANRPEILAAYSHGQGITTRFSKTIDINMMYYALAVKSGGDLLGYVRTSLPLSVIDNRLSHIHTLILFAMSVSIIKFFAWNNLKLNSGFGTNMVNVLSYNISDNYDFQTNYVSFGLSTKLFGLVLSPQVLFGSKINFISISIGDFF